jgi:glutamate-1-semialdehyde aminotransferase
MPLSILAGRREVMQVCERDVFFYTTFGGETLSLAAAKATIGVMQREPVIATLARQGKKLMDGYNALARDLALSFTECVGYPARSLVKLAAPEGSTLTPLHLKTFVQQEMIARGILWGGFHNMCYAHGDADVERVLGAYREVLPMLKDAVDAGDLGQRLRGKLLEPVFRKVENFHTRPVRR